MYFYEINKLIIFFFHALEIYFCCLLSWVEVIFHNKQNLPTEGYMLNACLNTFLTMIIIPIGGHRTILFLIYIFFQLLNDLQVFFVQWSTNGL
jgi:hypothetical protein